MQKKSLGAVACFIGVLMFLGAGCGQSPGAQDPTVPPVPDTGEEASEPGTGQPLPKTSGKATDAQCLDVMARQMWAVSLLQAKHNVLAAGAMVKEAEELQARYGISDDDFENICNAKIGDIDFYDRLEARMTELGFVIE